MSVRQRTTLVCDRCGSLLDFWGTATQARAFARVQNRWRRDKAGRDICPAHPKLKGAR